MKKQLTALAFATLIAASSASAATLWSDDFNRGAGPLTLDYTGNTVNDYGTATNGGYATLSSNALNIVDNTANNFRVSVLKPEFVTTTLNAGDTVTLFFDLKVASFASAQGASTFRFSLYDNVTDNAGSGNLTIGFGRYDATNYGFFQSTNVGAVGSVIGSAFGVYDAVTATNNSTAENFYRVAMTVTQGSTAVTGVITNLGTSTQFATFNSTLGAAFDWNGNTTGVDGFQFQTGAGGTGDFTIDNIGVTSASAVPEPSAYGLLGAGACGVATLVRRRRKVA